MVPVRELNVEVREGPGWVDIGVGLDEDPRTGELEPEEEASEWARRWNKPCFLEDSCSIGTFLITSGGEGSRREDPKKGMLIVVL